MVLLDSHRISRVLWYSGVTLEAARFRVQGCHLLWLRLSRPIPLTLIELYARPYNPQDPKTLGLGNLPVSLATTRGITIVFSSWGY